jgi:hypothetical protein
MYWKGYTNARKNLFRRVKMRCSFDRFDTWQVNTEELGDDQDTTIDSILGFEICISLEAPLPGSVSRTDLDDLAPGCHNLSMARFWQDQGGKSPSMRFSGRSPAGKSRRAALAFVELFGALCCRASVTKGFSHHSPYTR